ncbi:hypothetical protein QR680_015740 [Steinernema hermaphroditum]|uniref:Uncharacterized protein n=1 Tax=Steinernema hermaphroditum TaxID=289476 RepID=A0AA39H8U6_9BILA|nr:hypothetical protein QR680_015740 [Steinernema hermaphroditum]
MRCVTQLNRRNNVNMELLIVHHDHFDRLYNCSFKSYDEWLYYGVQNFFHGQLYLVLGTIYLLLYIPILIVISRPPLIHHSCWKIMFFLGIVDICSTIINCIIPGYMGIKGFVGCNYITFFYLAGSTAIACWFCQCCTCLVLAINRCVDFWKVKWMLWLFEGRRIFLWISLSLIYAFTGFFFCAAPIFSSLGMAYFFDPYYLIPSSEVPIDRSVYHSMFHSINNMVIVVFLPLIYAFLVLSVWWKNRGSNNSFLSKLQRQLFFQVFWICTLNFTAAFLYVYMQFFPIPFFFITVGQVMWQGSNGGAVVVYLALNKTIRIGVFRMICTPFAKYQNGTMIVTAVASASVQPVTVQR